MGSFRKYFSAVRGSIRGVINPRELRRSILTALGSGSILGLLALILESVLSHASTVFPDPTTSTLATMVLTLVLDLLRRQNHGESPASATE